MGQRNGTYSAQVFRPVMNKKLTVARGYKEDEKVVCVSCEVCVYCWTKRRRIPDYYSTPNMQHARRQGSSYSLPILMCWSCVLHTSVISHVRSCGSEQVRCKRYRHRYVQSISCAKFSSVYLPFCLFWARSCPRLSQPFMPLQGATRQVR